jgi:hypothetical protein
MKVPASRSRRAGCSDTGADLWGTEGSNPSLSSRESTLSWRARRRRIRPRRAACRAHRGTDGSQTLPLEGLEGSGFELRVSRGRYTSVFRLSHDQRCASACWQTPGGIDGSNPAPSGGESGAKPILSAGCEGASGIVGMELRPHMEYGVGVGQSIDRWQVT